MRKYILTITLLFFTLPVFAVCPINGVCAAPPNSILAPNTIQDKYLPNNLDNLRKTNTFSPQFVNPYDEMRMNTGEDAPQYSPPNLTPQLPYNSNCQFGMCLP